MTSIVAQAPLAVVSDADAVQADTPVVLASRPPCLLVARARAPSLSWQGSRSLLSRVGHELLSVALVIGCAGTMPYR